MRALPFLLVALIGQISSAAEPDPCKAASTKPAYESAVPVSAALQKKIETYREQWRTLCDKKSKKKRPSLAVLYDSAAEIATDFQKNVLGPLGREGLKEEKADKVSDVVTEKYPSFVPAFEGSFVEYEYFRPVYSAFAAKSELGTSEDKAFWLGYASLRGPNLLYPWYEQTWDYGGCLRYGEFDWVKEIEALESLKKAAKSVAYAELVTEIENAFATPFVQALAVSQVCACKSKDSVLVDLKKLAKFFREGGAASTVATALKGKVDTLIADIEAKKVAVLSQSEAHCSGG